MTLPINQIINKDWIEAAKELPDQSVHCIITSPPYWGQRNYGVEGQLGLEATPELHIEKLVAGFRELRRVLRDDGTLWVNYGDKYAGSGGENDNFSKGIKKGTVNSQNTNLDSGNLLGLAWRLALALQADGWILRSDIIWAKGLSFCDSYSGSVMPESVNGWRWERCRVKVKELRKRTGGKIAENQDRNDADGGRIGNQAWNEYKDCPGCPKCEKNGGYVFRKGSWRPTKGHEYLFMFAKKQGYYCDMEAVREPQTSDPNKIKPAKGVKNVCDETTGKMMRFKPQEIFFNPSGRNLRDVWVINPQVWSRAHYATFPEKLVEPIIKVSTSQKGVCPKCGSQWCRVVDVYQQKLTGSTGKTKVPNANNWEEINNRTNRVSTTLGWRPTCGCQSEISYLKSLEPIPAVVYDPFMGSGTVAAVAAKLGRNYCGSELSKDYLDNQANIRIAEAETGVTMEEIEAGQGALFE